MNNGRVIDNDSFQWRRPARVVAYLDLVFSSIGLILLLLLAIFTIEATATLVDDDVQRRLEEQGVSQKQTAAALIVLWVSVAIAALLISIDFWSAVMLLKATNVGSEAKKAYDRARIWRNVSIVFLVMNIFGCFGSANIIGMILAIILRGVIIYIVVKFMQELDAAAAGSFPNPHAVIIQSK